jgi:hypothetical protein
MRPATTLVHITQHNHFTTPLDAAHGMVRTTTTTVRTTT